MPSVNASDAGGSIRLPARVRTRPDRWLHGSLANHGDLSWDFEEKKNVTILAKSHAFFNIKQYQTNSDKRP